jgi:hypothetical protein
MVHHHVSAFFSLYVHVDIYSQVDNKVLYPTMQEKWDKLQRVYGGTDGSTTVFNLWILLIESKLDDSKPLAPQFAKLQEAKVALSNAKMGLLV